VRRQKTGAEPLAHLQRNLYPFRLDMTGPVKGIFKMPKPLISEDPKPRDLQFTHFGVLDPGSQSKGSLFGAVTMNVLLVLIAAILGAAAKKTMVDNRLKEISLVIPLKEKPIEPIKPKIPPPKVVPPPPKPMIKPPEPKIVLPEVKLIKPPEVVHVEQPKPVPVVMPAPPKMVVAAAAPKPVAVNLAQAASVVNHDSHPSAVALGHPDSLIPVQKGPAVAAVNLSQKGLGGMPPSNSGGGPPSTKVSLGSGQPDGKIGGTGVVAVKGVGLGCAGCTGQPGGNGTGRQVAQVALGGVPPPPAPVTQVAKGPQRTPPQVLFKPKPAYTPEASAMHLEGTVSVKIRVSSAGVVTVVGVTSGLGHGLDESAIRAAQGIRFKPATDASGAPVDWEGIVSIIFQMA
jgi:protein TonB